MMYHNTGFGISGEHGFSGINGKSYAQQILNVVGKSNVLALWMLNETSGAIADNYEGTAARDGAYTGVTLADAATPWGGVAPRLDGANDFVNVYTTSLNDAFSGSEGSAVIWAKMSGAGVWTDGSFRTAIGLWGTGASNDIIILDKSGANNTFRFFYSAGGTVETLNHSISTTDFFQAGITWSATADEVKFYANGIQVGTTQTALGTWTEALNTARTNIGCRNNAGPDQVFDGWLAAALVTKNALSLAQINSLYTKGGGT